MHSSAEVCPNAKARERPEVAQADGVSAVEIDCFIYDGWRPRIRAASARREWMDETPESFAYRCLPLSIANSQGWEIANTIGFSARWTGGSGVEAVEIRFDDHLDAPIDAPVSLFGQGTLTFHIPGLFRTPPGWNLSIGGAPNEAKDGISPLSGIIETDWSPYSFTMNWRFTRAHHWVRFEVGETICFFYPVQRGIVEAVQPRVRPIEEAPQLKTQFEDWSASRNAFQATIRETPPSLPSEKWQKLYYRGVCPMGDRGAPDHQVKVRPKEFANLPDGPPPIFRSPSPAVAPPAQMASQLARRDSLLRIQEELLDLSPRRTGLRRLNPVDADDFLDHHYAANRPALLDEEMREWVALKRWTLEHLSTQLGGAPIELQTHPTGVAHGEGGAEGHRRTMPFDQFIAENLGGGEGNRSHALTSNSPINVSTFAPLHADLGRIDKLLIHGASADQARLSMASVGAFSPLHCALRNSLLAQIVGQTRILLVPPSEESRLRDIEHVIDGFGDLLDPSTQARHPDLRDLRLYDLLLEPGVMLFIPVGWWSQATAQDFSVNATFTNFRWRNDWRLDSRMDSKTATRSS
ncbi:hypothetical protein BH10PSE4_BH10PSE4_06240 [soil metagenome]